MTEELIPLSQEGSFVGTSKWGKSAWASQPTNKVARRILEARLQTVWYWLPLAAEKNEEDVEYVHQLRIATRRAAEALRVLSNLVPSRIYSDTRKRLRRIRLAADEARNWDVLSALFLHCPDASSVEIVSKIVEEVQHRRHAAQQPIVAIYQELVVEKFGAQIDKLVKAVRRERKGYAKRKFARQAPQYLRGVLKQFFKASDADLSNDEALHSLRICTKKLRYTMEMVAVAFEPAFREKLYPQISVLQNIMGIVNDHAMSRVFFHDWSLRVQDAHEKAFLDGLVLAEAGAHQDVRRVFSAMWTPKTVTRLRRQFRMCCGLP